MLQNFKKFPELDLRFSNDRNILVGDNESGKSTILLALDLVLSDSRHRVEALGVESLLSQSAVRHFQEGERRADQLPVLTADVFLSNGGDPDLNGRQNLAGIDADGLRMRIAPMTEEYGQDIHHVLQQDPDNFPYEYYSVRFSTFSGGHFAGFRRYLRHLFLDSARIDNEHAAQEYTRTVYSVNVPVADRYRLENSYRQQKMQFCARHLSAINDTLETYQFGVRSGAKSGLEANLDITEDGISIRHRGKGRQCFIKTEFALQRHQQQGELHALLLEEPENHLSHVSMCSATVCEFITGQLNIRISAHGIHTTRIETVTDEARSAALHADDTVIKLFYREHHRYGCHSMNWGGSKGLDHFQDVCIVMGANHWVRLIQQKLAALPPSSRNRLYVACSRARGNIYFIPESHLRRFRN